MGVRRHAELSRALRAPSGIVARHRASGFLDSVIGSSLAFKEVHMRTLKAIILVGIVVCLGWQQPSLVAQTETVPTNTSVSSNPNPSKAGASVRFNAFVKVSAAYAANINENCAKAAGMQSCSCSGPLTGLTCQCQAKQEGTKPPKQCSLICNGNKNPAEVVGKISCIQP